MWIFFSLFTFYSSIHLCISLLSGRKLDFLLSVGCYDSMPNGMYVTLGVIT
jgi:hypothetical protein